MKLSPVLIAAAILLAPAVASAQPVQGRLIARETDEPVRGGTVHLMADSQVVAQARTDSAGAFTLQAPRPGSYWLLGTAPGFQASETNVFAVGPAGARVRFMIGRPMIGLDTVTAMAAGAVEDMNPAEIEGSRSKPSWPRQRTCGSARLSFSAFGGPLSSCPAAAVPSDEEPSNAANSREPDPYA